MLVGRNGTFGKWFAIYDDRATAHLCPMHSIRCHRGRGWADDSWGAMNAITVTRLTNELAAREKMCRVRKWNKQKKSIGEKEEEEEESYIPFYVLRGSHTFVKGEEENARRQKRRWRWWWRQLRWGDGRRQIRLAEKRNSNIELAAFGSIGIGNV